MRQSGILGARFLSVASLPSQTDASGSVWQTAEVEAVFLFHGALVRSRWSCSAAQGRGRYSALVWAYQAPEQTWARDAGWLFHLVQRIVIVNPHQAARQDQGLQPRSTVPEEVYTGSPQ